MELKINYGLQLLKKDLQLGFGKIEPHASTILRPDITDGTDYSGILEIDVVGTIIWKIVFFPFLPMR